jgi:hypothetical protein
MEILSEKQLCSIVGGMGSRGSAQAQAEAGQQIRDTVDFVKGVFQGFYDAF